MKQHGILDPLKIPLEQRHLIEASAGTGKTYNITRIYVRLLVERKLSVQQILVMTFTEAATEEIRERIASFITELLLNFDSNPCDFSTEMQTRVGTLEAKHLLEIAALELDLGAIYTIHGFCQRVISRFGLSMPVPQQATLKPDFSKILRTCVSDSLLILQQRPEAFLLLQNKQWHIPTNFIDEFSSLLGTEVCVNEVSEAQILESQYLRFNECWHKTKNARMQLIAQINLDSSLLHHGLASTKANVAKIGKEIQEALQWLSNEYLVDVNEGTSLIQAWCLGELKDEIFLPKAFKALFSGVRLKKMLVLPDISPSHPLLVLSTEILTAMKDAGLSSEHKKNLKSSLDMCATFEVVQQLSHMVNKKLSAIKMRERVIGFDDLITTVASSVSGSDSFLKTQLQSDYPVALVDEFQDTDAQQYAIFDALYPKSNADNMLVMIGDPKQAIYSFRGGDIFTYLQAKDNADFVWNMSVNYRSSYKVIRGYNRIFNGAPLPDSQLQDLEFPHQDRQLNAVTGLPTADDKSLFNYNIDYHLIHAPSEHPKKAALLDPDNEKNVKSLAFVFASSERVKKLSKSGRNETKEISANQQNKEILTWCAMEIRRLLAEVSMQHISSEDEHSVSQRLLLPEDIAILVRSGSQAAMVKKVLNEHGLASVYLSEKSRLFASTHALNLLWFLEAIHQPTKTAIRRALSTDLLLIEDNNRENIRAILINEDDPRWEQVHSNVQQCAGLWKNKGIHALLQGVLQQYSPRTQYTERDLTNYLHLADELAKAEISCSTPAQLLYWLQLQVSEPEDSDTTQLRLESDQKLIKIVTQHKSKGLEYPIVFLPFANQGKYRHPGNVVAYHDSQHRLKVQLGWAPDALARHQHEDMAEDMRLLYVSLTRPILRTYVGISGRAENNANALMRALDVSIDKACEYEDLGSFLRDEMSKKLADVKEIVSFSYAHQLPPVQLSLPQAETTLVTCNIKTMPIDSTWQVSSFSRISKTLHGTSEERSKQITTASTHNAEPFIYQRDAEPISSSEGATLSQIDTKISPTIDTSAYAFNFPKGPNAGNFLHDLLEALDFNSNTLSEHVTEFCTLESAAMVLGDHELNTEALSEWIRCILDTPLNAAEKLSLSGLEASKVLKESEFYFSLSNMKISELATIVNNYRTVLYAKLGLDSAPMINTASHAAFNHIVNGAMHGFIDLIFEHDDKYFVADYKSNYLGADYLDYIPVKLASDIIKHDYDLQFLIYSLALHRYLRLKVPNYNYDVHFGGVYYLFLRGMRPSEANSNVSNTGVFYDTIPFDTIEALDALFALNEQHS